MTLGELRAATSGLPDSAVVTVLNTWDGEAIDVEDVSTMGVAEAESTDAVVTIEVTVRGS